MNGGILNIMFAHKVDIKSYVYGGKSGHVIKLSSISMSSAYFA